jgi:predicted transcriptional regulator
MAVAQVVEERKMLGIRVPEDIINALDTEATRLRRSRNHIILEALEARLGYVDGRPPTPVKAATKNGTKKKA